MSAADLDLLAQEMMTLAGIAYGRPANIPGYLADDTLATRGRWAVHWMPADVDIPVNFAFLARNARDGSFAVVIRGTYPNPLNPAYWEDAGQDSPFGTMVAWPYPADANALVSKGTWAAFQSVTGLMDTGGGSFVDAVAALPAGAKLFVTGHSLGGTLAPVVAQWARGLTSRPEVCVYTFAGMTPGNAAFADLVGGATRRYYNDLDSVPYGWDAVLQTRDFYQPAPKGGTLYQDAIDDMARKLADYPFAAVGTPIRLAGTVDPPRIDIPFVSFLIENLRQHLPDTYLTLLGAPLLPFTIGFGATVAETTGSAAATWHAMPASFA